MVELDGVSRSESMSRDGTEDGAEADSRVATPSQERESGSLLLLCLLYHYTMAMALAGTT